MPMPTLHFYVVKPRGETALDPSVSCHVVAAQTSENAMEHLRSAPPIRGPFQARLAGTMTVPEFLQTVRGATAPVADSTGINAASALRFAVQEYGELATPIEAATVMDLADKIEARTLAFMFE